MTSRSSSRVSWVSAIAAVGALSCGPLRLYNVRALNNSVPANSSMVYSLPMTELRFTLEVKKTTPRHAPFRSMRTLFGMPALSNVPFAWSESAPAAGPATYNVESAQLETAAIADPDRRFVIDDIDDDRRALRRWRFSFTDDARLASAGASAESRASRTTNDVLRVVTPILSGALGLATSSLRAC
jgi:hypothetical protein